MKQIKAPIKNSKGNLSNSITVIDKDIFENNSTLIQPGKLFMSIFGSYYSQFEVQSVKSFEKQKYLDEIKSIYRLDGNQFFLNDTVSLDEENAKISDYYLWKVFVILKHGLAIWIEYKRVLIFYNNSIEKKEVLEIAAVAEKYKKTEVMRKEFHMVVKERFGFELHNFEVKEYCIDIGLNYNDDFKDIDGIITSNLSEANKNGIILLHGNYGTGKTYYIRNLINTINRRFIYIPLNMVHYLSDPDFIPFISHFKYSVLILEDCENLLMHRDDGNPHAGALANLLNFGDGLLSDAFKINIICSFNSSLKKIDDALLRKGRLIARYEFKELELHKAQSLADRLGKNIIVEKPMTLTDIYNAECMKFENKKANKIGFAYA